ncbi:hypothetical protein NDU88_007473 [Pleurodeles waltl]|uniref:Retrotransposon gag domain-containing protein n=1 Tax=Pleurodeles waltl TaxID=8319 RepID=A0AAV7N716_PLEWA|nr:hypothetical protein NDU88_007473 [Pleurodeles waltl]
MASIPALEPFVIDGPPSALAARWKEWVDPLETYFAATAVENDQRRPMLLHLGGAAVQKLGRSVVEEGPPYTYQSLKQALTAHFEPLANPDYERFLLRQARQFPYESVDAFYARLKDLARTCTLVDVADEVRDTIPHVPECNDLHQQVGEALSRRKDRNDEMSRKRGAKERDICVGDMVLVKCRKGGSTFLLPFEKDPWILSDVKGTMITAKRGSKSITQNISFYKKVYASDFQVPIDISSWDQDYDDVTLQSPGGVLCPDMQSPGGIMALDLGTGQLVPMSSDVLGSGDHWVEEPITSISGLARPVTSTRGDDPYNLRPRPQCSTRLRGFVVN